EVRATLFDIAPTILALLGLPIPEDLPGRVLEELLEPEFLARYPIRRIASYEDLIPLPARAPGVEGEDEEALEMLRALGYIE
ncbi:MAG: phosphodiesterase, partial [Thermoanaerobaculia bacterium]